MVNSKTQQLMGGDAHLTAVFEEGNPQENPWVDGAPMLERIEVQAHDPAWAAQFLALKQGLQAALAGKALAIEHVGFTAVPGLLAKPVIDIDLIVADPGDEDAYVPALASLGYRLTVRERSWDQHRMLRLDAPRVNLHVFGPACPEHMRHLLFRDWLRADPSDRLHYADAKAQAKAGADTAPTYNQRKQAVVRAIYDKIFESLGLVGAA